MARGARPALTLTLTLTLTLSLTVTLTLALALAPKQEGDYLEGFSQNTKPEDLPECCDSSTVRDAARYGWRFGRYSEI